MGPPVPVPMPMARAMAATVAKREYVLSGGIVVEIGVGAETFAGQIQVDVQAESAGIL